MLNLLEELDNWALRGMVVSSSFPLVESMEHQGCQIFPSRTLLAMIFSGMITHKIQSIIEIQILRNQFRTSTGCRICFDSLEEDLQSRF